MKELNFIDLVVSTAVALVFFYLGILVNKRNARISLTNDLITRYKNDYRDLRTSSTIHKHAEIQDEEIDDPHSELKRIKRKSQYEINYWGKVNFYCELGMYWKKGLIDKNIIKSHFNNPIVEICDSLDKTYKDKGGSDSIAPELVGMKDDMEKMELPEDRFKKLYSKMNIRK
jgi:hypothetical protein